MTEESKPMAELAEPVTIIDELHSHAAPEPCPTCHGRGTVADGVHDAYCAPCAGTGKSQNPRIPESQNPETSDGASKPDS